MRQAPTTSRPERGGQTFGRTVTRNSIHWEPKPWAREKKGPRVQPAASNSRLQSCLRRAGALLATGRRAIVALGTVAAVVAARHPWPARAAVRQFSATNRAPGGSAPAHHPAAATRAVPHSSPPCPSLSPPSPRRLEPPLLFPPRSPPSLLPRLSSLVSRAGRHDARLQRRRRRARWPRRRRSARTRRQRGARDGRSARQRRRCTRATLDATRAPGR